MYYPYLRGKQFELIALRDLIKTGIVREKIKISPVIEPIKLSSTLEKTFLDFTNNDINFNVIINPQVGDLKNKADEIISFLETKLNDYSNYQIGLIFESKSDYEVLLQKIELSKITCNGFTLIHNIVIPNISEVIANCKAVKPIINNV